MSDYIKYSHSYIFIGWERAPIFLLKFAHFSVFPLSLLCLFYQDSYDNLILSQSLMPGTHLFCVYGDNWFQSVRYTLRCLVAVPQDTDCVETIKSTEEKLSVKKKELEKFQVRATLTILFNVCLMFTSSVRVLRN